jgi:plastocyanin
MHTIHRTAIAGLLLTLAACSSAPTRENNDTHVMPATQMPTAVQAAAMDVSVPKAIVEVAPAPEPTPVPVIVPAEPAVVMVKPASKPVSASKPAPVTKPVAVATAPQPDMAATGSISGTLKLVAGQGQSVDAGEVSEGLVYFLPKAGSPKPKPGHFSINTRSKGFSPETLVVPQSSTVHFPNVDTIIHNVYSRSPGNSFDLGYYGPGKSPDYTFNTPGLAIVNCSVHHNMRANIVVLTTPYYTRPGKDGHFQIKDVPPGPGTLVFWHPRAVAKSVQASAPLAGAVTQTLVASKSPQMH